MARLTVPKTYKLYLGGAFPRSESGRTFRVDDAEGAFMANAAQLFATRCVDGIQANVERCEGYAEASLSVATALNPFIGYDKASEIVKTAHETGRTLREVATELGVSAEVLDQALDFHAMTTNA